MTDNIENSSQKSELAAKIGSTLFRRDISMGQAAKLFGIKQIDVNQLLQKNLDDFSVEELEEFLKALEE